MLTMLAKDSQFHKLSSPIPDRGGAARLLSSPCDQQFMSQPKYDIRIYAPLELEIPLKLYCLVIQKKGIIAELFSPGKFFPKCATTLYIYNTIHTWS